MIKLDTIASRTVDGSLQATGTMTQVTGVAFVTVQNDYSQAVNIRQGWIAGSRVARPFNVNDVRRDLFDEIEEREFLTYRREKRQKPAFTPHRLADSRNFGRPDDVAPVERSAS
jgi:hypothetical protein